MKTIVTIKFELPIHFDGRSLGPVDFRRSGGGQAGAGVDAIPLRGNITILELKTVGQAPSPLLFCNLIQPI